VSNTHGIGIHSSSGGVARMGAAFNYLWPRGAELVALALE